MKLKKLKTIPEVTTKNGSEDNEDNENENSATEQCDEQKCGTTPKKQLRNTRNNDSETSINSILPSNNNQSKKVELLK